MSITGWELRLYAGAGLLAPLADWDPSHDDAFAAEMAALAVLAPRAEAVSEGLALPAVVLTPAGAAALRAGGVVQPVDAGDAVAALAAAGAARTTAASVRTAAVVGGEPGACARAGDRSDAALLRRLFRATAHALLSIDDGAAGDPLRGVFDFGERDSDSSE
jgi:hypothetical protein